jgi:hypothetical protein
MLFIFNELRTATAAATSDKLGEILLREGLITQDQLKKALLEQKNTGMRLGYTLVKLGFVEETEISKMLARQYRMPAVDLSRFEVDAKIIKLLPPDVAIKHTVLPLKREGRTLTVAIADPNNVTAIEDIKFITRCDVFPVIAGTRSTSITSNPTLSCRRCSRTSRRRTTSRWSRSRRTRTSRRKTWPTTPRW